MDASKRRRISPNNEDVTDAEVEEFYAILRRIRPLTKPRRGAAIWNPSFTPEDFVVRKEGEKPSSQQDAPEVQSDGNGASAVTRDFDLNEDPEPDAVRGRKPGEVNSGA